MQFVVQQAATRPVRLKPLTVNHELRNGPLAHMAHHLSRCGRISVHVDFGVLDAVRFKELLCRSAVPAPACCINLHLHASILQGLRW